MSTSKLIIRTSKGCINSNGSTIIFLLYSHAGKTLYLSTGEKIKVDAWDSKRCEAKKSFRGYSTLNMVIQTFKEKVDTIAREAKLKEPPIEPTCDYIKSQLRQKKEVKQNNPSLLEFISIYAAEQVTLKNKLTITSYKNTLNHLREYCNHIGSDISYNDIDLKFYDSFLSYLFKKKNLSNNGAGNHIKRLKVFMGVALERGYHNNTIFKSRRFKVLSETADTVFLNEQELEQLIAYDFSKNDERLVRVRDFFYIMSWCGIRYGDASKLRNCNICNGNIICNTSKTETKVIIPIFPKVQTILNKYFLETGESFPKIFKGEQKFNKHIKEVCRIAGLDRTVMLRKSKGGRVIQVVGKLYEHVSSHTARRSACTNLYKMGVPSIVIMKISGHKTERNFMKYIKISQENAADILREFWNKRNTTPHSSNNKSVLTEPISLNGLNVKSLKKFHI